MPLEFVSAKSAALLGAKLAGADACFSPEDRALCRQACVPHLQSTDPAISATGGCIAGRRTMAILDASCAQSNAISTMASMRLPVVSMLYSQAHPQLGELHSAFYSLTDTGCIMFSPENLQELLDLVIHAYRVSEDRKVLLPSVVQFDDPHLAEDVSVPGDKVISAFIKHQALPHKIDAKKPAALGGPSWDAAIKMQQVKAMENAASLYKSVAETWNTKFRRAYSAVEAYKTDDADFILVTMGSHSLTAKKAADTMRERGVKVGVARIRIFRPFPYRELSEILSKSKAAATADFSAPIGGRTPLQRETCTASSFAIMKRPSEKDFEEMFGKISNDPKAYWVI